MVGLAAQRKLLVLFVHIDLAAAGDAAGTHAPGHNGSVRGHAAANSQDALGNLHAGDILRRSLQTNQNNLLASGGPLFRILSREHDLAAKDLGKESLIASDIIQYLPKAFLRMED